MSADKKQLTRARQVRKLLRADSGTDLTKIDPRGTPGLPSRMDADMSPKDWSRAEVTALGTALGAYQERLYAAAETGADRRRVLLVLQAMDCGGKDGTVKSVIGATNPLGVRITAFGAPTKEELSHHFLWRIVRALPPAGYVGVFNRSHYEDVLVVRVRSLVPERVWRHRYDEINEFESALVRDELTLVKIMLHISYEEQGERLLARLDDPTKRWKFNPSDLDDRAHWDHYQAAYSDALARCSTLEAPWYVVPADRKWYRNWAVANILLAHFAELKLQDPQVAFDVDEQRRRIGDPEVITKGNNE